MQVFKKSKFILLLIILVSCSSNKIADNHLARINQYDDAANFLTLIVDQELNSSETCQLSSKNALELLGPLHAMIDDEINNNPYKLTLDVEENCSTYCHCGIYSDITQDSQRKELLFQKASKITKNALLSCAQKTAKWICKSPLLDSLKAEASRNSSPQADGL